MLLGSSSWSRTRDFHSRNHGFESRTEYKTMTHGVTVTQQILVLLFEVRILVGQLIIQYTDYATVRRGGERQMT